MVLVEYPCTPWSILQRNVNFLDDPEALHRLQLADKPFLKLTKDIFDGQVRRGGHALTENPATADSQKEPEIQDLRQRFYETTSCMCRFGMRGRGGKLLRKRVRWIATHKKFVEALDLQCRGDHEHEKVEGQNTALSAQYPPKLADVICKTYLDVVSEEDFGVHYSWEPFERRGAYFIDVIKEEDKWRPLLQFYNKQRRSLRERFRRISSSIPAPSSTSRSLHWFHGRLPTSRSPICQRPRGSDLALRNVTGVQFFCRTTRRC